MIILYNNKLKPLAHKLRINQIYGERKLWKYLRNKQVYGYKFIRQKPISNFIIDFYCKDLKLAIEIDGSSHDERKYDYDLKRQKEIEKLGITVLRFTEYQVHKRTDEVLQGIYFWVEEHFDNTHPNPPSREGN